MWKRLCDAYGLDAADPRFATNDDRIRNRPELVSVLEDAFAATSSRRLLEELSRAGVPAGKVRSLDEVYSWDQVHSQGLQVTVDHQRLGSVRLAGPPLRFFDGEENETTKTSHAAPPVLDADGATIRSWLSRDDLNVTDPRRGDVRAGRPSNAVRTS